MKEKMLVALAVVAMSILVMATASAGKPTDVPFAHVELNNSTVSPDIDGAAQGLYGIGSCFDFNAPVEWAYASSAAATAYSGYDQEVDGWCTFGWTGKDQAQRIVLSVLDTAEDDSFEVLTNRYGDETLVYSYTDPQDGSMLEEHTITRFSWEKRHTKRVQIRIHPKATVFSNPHLAVACVKLYNSRK
jgi:hypothetical protein